MAISVETFRGARCLEDGTMNNNGTYLKVILKFTSDESATYQVDYKRYDQSTWSRFTSGTGTNINVTVNGENSILNYDYPYNVRLTITAGTDSVVRTALVSTGFVLVDFNASGKGIAIGKVSEKDNEMEINMPVYDRFGTQVLNGFAFYETSGSTNIDTSTEELILANVEALGGFFFIRQMFYNSKTSTSNRTQIAIPYARLSGSSMIGHLGSNYRRHYVQDFGWSQWREEPIVIDSGENGIWTYKKYSDGNAECFGKISVSDVAVTSALGNWFRSDVMYAQNAYYYPIEFSEAPAVEMMFHTTNGNGALLWAFSPTTAYARSYLPQCYLIRPTSLSGINGNINIVAKGKITL